MGELAFSHTDIRLVDAYGMSYYSSTVRRTKVNVAKCYQLRSMSEGFPVLFIPSFHLSCEFEIFQNINLGSILKSFKGWE